MRQIFLLSEWDKEDFLELLASYGESIPADDLLDGTALGDQSYDQLVIVISPASVDSTQFQERVLKALDREDLGEVYCFRLNDVRIPVGFGQLCNVPDWIPNSPRRNQ